MKDETDWQRQLLVGVVVLVAVGALIGGIVAFISIKAADLAGIDDTNTSQGRDRPRQAAPSSSDEPEPTEGDSTGPTASPPTPSGGSNTPKPPEDTGITLQANPGAVSTYERINLTGTFEAPSGTLLQVQRKEGPNWVDFPISPISLNGGKFATYVETGRSGVNVFRMLALGRDETSNPVSVQVG